MARDYSPLAGRRYWRMIDMPVAVTSEPTSYPSAEEVLPHQEAGTCSGVNILPGSEDDGWIVPQPVVLDDGTSIQLYKDGEALHAAFDAIRTARRRVCLEVYIFRSDPTGRAFADLLVHKARQGVAVYVIYDSFGSWDSDRMMFRKMRDAGVRLSAFHPIRPWECRYGWRPINRDHRKVLIIDDDIAGLGGLNIGAEYAGSWVVKSHRGPEPWRDTAVGIRGPAARTLLIPFVRMWRYVNHGGKLRRTGFVDNEDEGEFGILGLTPAYRKPVWTLRRMLREARERILMTMAYFCPPDELIGDLCAAAQRGVSVRLMLPGVGDIKALVLAQRAFYSTLLDAGVQIYERQGAVLHAKTICIDDQSIIGSTNLDYRSIEYNCELSAIIRNSEFAEQMRILFENDVGYARAICAGEWRGRPFYDRFVQWMVYRARYLL